MNVQKGDLAIVIGGRSGANVGKIVRVVEWCEAWSVELTFGGNAVAGWLIEGQDIIVSSTDGRRGAASSAVARDEWLRPIRDQPGEDEMLRIAGNPAQSASLATTVKGLSHEIPETRDDSRRAAVLSQESKERRGPNA